MGDATSNTIIAALHEAPFDPECWVHALNGAARACGAASAQLLSFGSHRFTPVIAPGFSADDVSAFVALGGADPVINHGLRAVRASRLHAILSDAEYLSDGARRKDRLYNEFFRAFDGEFVASGTVARNGSAVCNLNLFLPRRTGGLGDEARRTLRRLLPSFTEAVRLTARLEDMSAALTVGAWDALGEAAVICAADGRVLHANQEAERLIAASPSCRLSAGRLEAADPATAQALAEAIRSAGHPLSPRSRAVPAFGADGAGLLIEVAPLPPASTALDTKVLVLLRETNPSVRLDDLMLAAAFGLTPAECAVAAGLMQRLSTAEIARARKVSNETVNTQVKAVLAKTGCASRSEATLKLQPFIVRTRRFH